MADGWAGEQRAAVPCPARSACCAGSHGSNRRTGRGKTEWTIDEAGVTGKAMDRLLWRLCTVGFSHFSRNFSCDIRRRKGVAWICQHYMMQYSAVQDRTVQCSAVQDRTEQDSAVQYSTVQNRTVQYSTVQYSTAQHSTAQQSTV